MALTTRSARVRFAFAVMLYLVWIAALAFLAVWSGARPPSASRTSAGLDRARPSTVAAPRLSGRDLGRLVNL